MNIRKPQYLLASQRKMLHCNIMTTKPSRPKSDSRIDAMWRAPVEFARPMNIDTAARIGEAAFVEAKSISSLSLKLFQERCTTAAAGIGAFMKCRTPQDILAAQAALLCEDLDLIRSGCERLSEIISEAAGDAVRLLPGEAGGGPAPLA